MTKRTTRALGATLLGLTLPLTACGAGGDEEQAATSIASQLREAGTADLRVSQEEANCIGEGFVDEIGTDQLQEYGLLNEDLEATQKSDVELSQDDADKAATVFQDCADVKALMLKGMEGSGMPASAQDCVEGKLDDDTLHDLLVGTFSGDQGVLEELGPKLQECITAG